MKNYSKKTNSQGNSEIDSLKQKIKKIEAENKKLKTQISEKKKKEDTDLFNEIFNSINSGIAIYKVIENGKDFIFIDFNKTAEKIDKQKKEHLVGKSIFEARPGAEDFGLIDVFRRVFKTGKPEYHPVKLYKDKKLKNWYENYIFKLNKNHIAAVFNDTTERMQTLEALRESEEKFRIITESAIDCIFLKNRKREYTFINPAMEKLFHCKAADILGKTPEQIFDRESAEIIKKTDDDAFEGKIVNEVREVNIQKEKKTFHTIQVPLKEADGKINSICGIVRDVSEQKDFENQIKESLKEKDVLLREIHHRVKNNLQVVSSIISLQLHTIKDDNIKILLIDTMNRIQSIALIHKQLYDSKNFAEIDFCSFADSLLVSLLKNYEVPGIKIINNCKRTHITIDLAIPLAIILNEIVTNSIKHAFPKNKGEITFCIQEEKNGFILEIKDNGTGMPRIINPDEIKSLGLNIITHLIHQINAEFSIDNKNGTKYTIIIPR